MYELVESHAHLDEIEDIIQTLADARQSNISAIVAVGTSLTSNKKILKLSQEHKGLIYPSLGLHPWNIGDLDFEQNIDFIKHNIDRSTGIGEIGLDYSKGVKERADKALQKSVFRELLELGNKHNKPAIIHSRYSWQNCLDIARETKIKKAVFHWYTGPLDILKEIVTQGYYISASPAVEYHPEHRKAIKEVPLEKLLLETDSPVIYHRGTGLEYRSKPADLVRTLRGVSELKNIDESTVAQITTNNARYIFNI
ncbi:MAG: TatD family hydrolase [Dehalococcoidales bacterium]|nr:TatD family hydrolase [Dehalococcoidales bacterium]